MKNLSRIAIALCSMILSANSYAQPAPTSTPIPAVACDTKFAGYLYYSAVQSAISNQADVTGDGLVNICFENALLLGNIGASGLKIERPLQLTGLGPAGTNRIIGSSSNSRLVEVASDKVTLDNLTLFATGEYGIGVYVSKGQGIIVKNSSFGFYGNGSSGLLVNEGQIESVENSSFQSSPNLPQTSGAGIKVHSKGSVRSVSKSSFYSNNSAFVTNINVIGGHVGRIVDSTFNGHGVGIQCHASCEIGLIARVNAPTMGVFLIGTHNSMIGSVSDVDINLVKTSWYARGFYIGTSKIHSLENVSISSLASVEPFVISDTKIGSITGLEVNLAAGYSTFQMWGAEIEQIDDFVINQGGSSVVFSIQSASATAPYAVGTLSNGFMSVKAGQAPINRPELIKRIVNVKTTTK